MSLRDYLYFSTSDRRSIVIIALVSVIAVATLLIVNTRNTGGYDDASPLPSDSSAVACDGGKHNTLQAGEILMKEFDPNTVDSATLVSFGLTSRQARTFIRYRAAGAVFRTPESLSRVYGLSPEDIDRLVPYVRIGKGYASAPTHDRNNYPRRHHSSSPRQTNFSSPAISDTTKTWREKRYPEKFRQLTKVDPNTADTTLLQRIPGIGSWISRNIVTHRDKLGGFHSVEQLLEVKYFPPERLEWFEVQATDVVLKKININTASFAALSTHPYIRYEQARDLQHYIRLYGKIPGMEQLRRTSIFTLQELDQLTPYLEF